MALSQEQLKELAAALTAAMDDMPAMPVELVCATGEIFSVDALKLARIYDKATNGQRQALDQIAAAFEVAR
ncbi:hypothetical protein LJR168_001780 [Pseudoxanthomonas sp. LjRoot168]|uniref:hypothetical protein n=1 Tax=unclassified Pseudoxanthomonas TaxID=2645906 RepID=UPI003ECFDD19